MMKSRIFLGIFLLLLSSVFADELLFSRTTGTPTINAGSIDATLMNLGDDYTWTGAHLFNGTITIGGGGLISKVLTGSSSINFTGITSTCEDSSAFAVTSAADGDTCQVGVPASLWGTGDSYSCYVSSAGNVKIRHCNVGAGADPGGATTIKVTITQ